MSNIQLLTKKQVAAALNVSIRTVERYVRSRDFPPPALVCGLPRWRERDVENYLNKRFAIARSE